MKISKLQYVFLNDNRIEQICSTQKLQSMKFIRMLNLCGNPFCELAAVRGQLRVHFTLTIEGERSFRSPSSQEHEIILYELFEQKFAAVTDDLNDFEADEEENYLIGKITNGLDSTDDSSLEDDLEVFLLNIRLITLTLFLSLQDTSILIPELSRYITNFS
uniref:U2A'/phosphoprotein 32 family A C-terminal domain-containing protein n=1 Tax=Glossina palpalis gambiensis TaxID=67801 RepID=A0A1B0BF60_9MUSC